MADNNLYVEEEFSTDNFPKSLRAAAFDFSPWKCGTYPLQGKYTRKGMGTGWAVCGWQYSNGKYQPA